MVTMYVSALFEPSSAIQIILF